jgi:hypothetical protein
MMLHPPQWRNEARHTQWFEYVKYHDGEPRMQRVHKSVAHGVTTRCVKKNINGYRKIGRRRLILSVQPQAFLQDSLLKMIQS